MTNSKIQVIILRILLFLSLYPITSCNFSGKFTRRYKSISTSDQACAINRYIEVNTSVIEKDPSPSPAAKGLTDLQPKGQAALIEKVSEKESTSTELISRLKSDLSIPPDRSIQEVVDFTRMSKRILTTVRKIQIQEGDRIERVYIKIAIADSNFKLRSCSRVITEYMNVDLGKINYTNSNQLEIAGNLGIGSSLTGTTADGVKNTSSEKNGDLTLGTERTSNNGSSRVGTSSIGINPKFSASRSMSEEVQLKQRLVVLNAFVKDNVLYLYQEGISGIDLTGNIIADVVCEYVNNVKVEKLYSFGGLFGADGAANGQNNIDVKENFVQSINVNNDIRATLSYEGVYRKIINGDKTISESDDEVQLLFGNTIACAPSASFVLIPKTSLRPNTWRLMYTTGRSRLPLHICNGAGMCGEILFNNFNNAVDFLRWIKSKVNDGSITLSNALGNKNHKLRLGDNTAVPNAAEINSLEVQLKP